VIIPEDETQREGANSFCMNEKDLSNVNSFVPAILVLCVGKMMMLELMDENDDHMEQLEWNGDNTVANMVGMYIKHPNETFQAYFQTMTAVTKSGEENNEFVTPRRAVLRKRAHDKLVKAADSMK